MNEKIKFEAKVEYFEVHSAGPYRTGHHIVIPDDVELPYQRYHVTLEPVEPKQEK